jgi:hypothetical protein
VLVFRRLLRPPIQAPRSRRRNQRSNSFHRKKCYLAQFFDNPAVVDRRSCNAEVLGRLLLWELGPIERYIGRQLVSLAGSAGGPKAAVYGIILGSSTARILSQLRQERDVQTQCRE